MITLQTSVRFSKYYEGNDTIENCITKFPAIDSRQDPLATCVDKGYSVDLKPVYKYHFARCRGAFGCTLSHAEIYQLIKNQPSDEYYCVLEDDVTPDTLTRLIETNEHDIPEQASIINLMGGVNTTAGYVINSTGAKLLLRELNNKITLPHDKFMFKHCKSLHPSSFHDMVSLERYIPTDLLDPAQRDLL